MFDIPESKRIRRDEILSPPSSTRSSPEVNPTGGGDYNNEEARAKLGRLLAFDTFTADTNQSTPKEGIAHIEKDNNEETNKAEDYDEQEFEFRLFSAPAPAQQRTTSNADPTTKQTSTNESVPGSGIKTQKLKIRLRSPTPIDTPSLGDGRFVVPFRGWDYYFTRPELMRASASDPARLEAEQMRRRKEFDEIAVTGAEVFQWAQTLKTPGLHLPWRVIHLNPKEHRVPKPILRQAEGATVASFSVATETTKKSKPGKKRRIILRTRAANAAAAARAATATANMTEAEKRNKKNREKKIRKRQREREKKAALAASGGSAAAAVVSDVESSD